MRKLASIQKIWKIEPIEGADRIELAHVLGWQCVVNKGQFKEGDYCIYFEIDSFLPIRKEFEFLRASSYKNSEVLGEGFKLRTQKFRGQISQGLCLPCDLFPELWIDPVEQMACIVPSLGQDVTELLGVKKWEIEERVTTGGTVIGELPNEVPHTNEIRIQAQPELLDEFKGLDYYISTKMDGSSHSIFLDRDRNFHVCGHNYEYKDDDSSDFYKYIKSQFYQEKSLEERFILYANYYEILDIVVQGEFCGAGIQKNRLKLKTPEWYVFTIIINGERMGLDVMLKVCEDLHLKTVPIEEEGFNLPNRYPTIDDLLKRAEGAYPNGGQKEGIVIRPKMPVYCNLIAAELSTKVINNKYLLKKEK